MVDPPSAIHCHLEYTKAAVKCIVPPSNIKIKSTEFEIVSMQLVVVLRPSCDLMALHIMRDVQRTGNAKFHRQAKQQITVVTFAWETATCANCLCLTYEQYYPRQGLLL